ncbi:PrsW family intramembrane metalloprotease [candidate division WOR-3 bacterium]|nr:PrsW family intramembrane metalloprotease [candidate division WOR-3 bacterium]
MVIVLLLLALAPCLFLLWYFYHRDKYEPEPKKNIFKIFLLGAVMVIPAGLLELGIGAGVDAIAGGIAHAFIMSFFVIAPIEELLKFFAVKQWIYRSLEFDEIMDGIVYTVAASLGFATVENLLYVFQHGVQVGIARAFLAVPGHAFFGAVMGYCIGRAKFDKEKEGSLLFKGILLAVVLHGLYDFLLLTQTILAVLVIILIIILGLFVRKNLKKAENQSKNRIIAEAAATAAVVNKELHEQPTKPDTPPGDDQPAA